MILLVNYLLELFQGSVHEDLFELHEAFSARDSLFLAITEVFGADKLAKNLDVVP